MKAEYSDVVALPAMEDAEFGRLYPRIRRRSAGTLYTAHVWPAAVIASVFALRAGKTGPAWFPVADNSMERHADDDAGLEACRAWLRARGVPVGAVTMNDKDHARALDIRDAIQRLADELDDIAERTPDGVDRSTLERIATQANELFAMFEPLT